MSLSIHLSHLSTEQIAFGYSPAHETLIALHVFYDCKHHPLHIPWVINTRKKVDSALKREIDLFSLFYKRPIVSFWHLHEESAIRSFESDLNELSCKPITFFCHKILETLLDQESMQKNSYDELLKKYPDSKELVLMILEDPEKVRLRFLDLMEAFWKISIKEDWPSVEELFLKDISFRGQKLVKEGPLQLIASLSKEIDIYPEESRAVIRRRAKGKIYFGEQDTLFLTPTYFAWPHLLVNRRNPVGINYSIMENQMEAMQPIPPENLLMFFRAMGDFTRMQIVKYLAQKPRSTRELAGLLGLTEGAVSKQLKQLSDAGLITSKRESYYVFYYLHEKPFKDIPDGLLNFIYQYDLK